MAKFTYRKLFTTPFEQYARHEGKPFEVLGVIDTPDENHDADVLPVFRVRIDGEEIEAWPEEVLIFHATDTPVWVVVIEHRHGTFVSVHLSEAGAFASVDGWVEDNWADEVGPDDMPEDLEERREQYFAHMADSESWVISNTGIEQ
jgi:hypothetical protein